MRNPFLLRASEQNISDEEFAEYFSPGVLELLPIHSAEWNKPLFIQSAPGAGKTSLFRLFTPGVLRHVIALRQTERSELYARLRDIGVIRNEDIDILGVTLACRTSFGRVERLDASDAIKERAFIALFNARVALATLRAAANFAQVRYPADLRELEFTSESPISSSIPADCNGQELFRWASSIESTLFDAFDSFSVKSANIPGEGDLLSLAWLRAASISHATAQIPQRRLLMVDDVHDLHPKQRKFLIDETVRTRVNQGVWFAERLQALDPDQIISPGARGGRDYALHVLIERAWSHTQKNFEKFVGGIADRRILQADDVRQSSFAPLLANALQFRRDELRRLQEVIDECVATLSEAERHFYRPLCDLVEAEATNELERAINWASLSIIVERDRRKKQTSFGFLDTTERSSEDLFSSGVRNAAELFVSKQAKLPYYFGFHRVTEASSWNVDQFLRVSGELFEQISAASLVGESPRIAARDQDRLLTRLSNRMFEEIGVSVPYGREVQRLLDAIGRFASGITRLPNAPYAPGVTGVALTLGERTQLVQDGTLAPGPYDKLCKVLASCLANNLLESRDDLRSKGQAWYVLFLNRLLCVKYDLPFSYGGWRPVSLKQLQRWSEVGYKDDLKLTAEIEV